MPTVSTKDTPNFSTTKYKLDTIVIHKTLGSVPGAVNWLTNKDSGVSAHFVVAKDGVIYHLLGNDKMAWHAGRIYNATDRFKKIAKKTNWASDVNPNKYCLGIECEALEADDTWTSAQMESLAWLVKVQAKELGITDLQNRLITHHDITSYKPNMDLWREELLRRLTPQDDKTGIKAKIVHLLSKL